MFNRRRIVRNRTAEVRRARCCDVVFGSDDRFALRYLTAVGARDTADFERVATYFVESYERFAVRDSGRSLVFANDTAEDKRRAVGRHDDISAVASNRATADITLVYVARNALVDRYDTADRNFVELV